MLASATSASSHKMRINRSFWLASWQFSGAAAHTTITITAKLSDTQASCDRRLEAARGGIEIIQSKSYDPEDCSKTAATEKRRAHLPLAPGVAFENCTIVRIEFRPHTAWQPTLLILKCCLIIRPVSILICCSRYGLIGAAADWMPEFIAGGDDL